VKEHRFKFAIINTYWLSVCLESRWIDHIITCPCSVPAKLHKLTFFGHCGFNLVNYQTESRITKLASKLSKEIGDKRLIDG
jgi:hypothetical protein